MGRDQLQYYLGKTDGSYHPTSAVSLVEVAVIKPPLEGGEGVGGSSSPPNRPQGLDSPLHHSMT